jgi:hypothetical protein
MAAARVALAALLLFLAAAGTALAGPATTDSDGDVLVFSVGVTPPQTSTAKLPQGVGLSLDAFAGNRIFANSAIPTDSLTFALPRGFVENGLLFPACRITPNAISPCASATQVGSGTAESELLNPGNQPPTFTPARVTIYNGAPLLGLPTLIMISRVGGRAIGELDFVVRPATRGLIVSQILIPDAGPGIGITKVSLTIPDRHATVRVKGKARAVHLLQAPQTCSGGAWAFALTTTSAARKPLTAVDREPCVQR